MLSTLHFAQLPSSRCLCSPKCLKYPKFLELKGTGRKLDIKCMAHPRRVAKVSSQITREISDMLVNDSVLQEALSPERKLGESMDLSAIPSVTNVYVSNDLQVVKVYLSIYSDPKGKQRAMNNLKQLEPYVRKEMGQRVPLRLTPEYRFEYDDTADEMDLVERVIGEEDVARFKREIQMEMEASRRNMGDDDEEEIDDEGEDAEDVGFFEDALLEGGDDQEGNGEEEEEDEEEETVKPKAKMAQPKKKVAHKRTSDSFRRPGPFDDLFGGEAEDDRLMVPIARDPPKAERKERTSKAKIFKPLSQEEISKGNWAPRKRKEASEAAN